MSNYYHGAKASKQATSVSTPAVADSSIHLIVGTAPVHTVGGKANEPVYASNYAEADLTFRAQPANGIRKAIKKHESLM